MKITETPIEYATRRASECNSAAAAWERVSAELWDRVRSLPDGDERDAWSHLACDASVIAEKLRTNATTAEAFLAFERVNETETRAYKVRAIIGTLESE